MEKSTSNSKEQQKTGADARARAACPGTTMDAIVCHCFGYTASDIASDIREHGASTLLARIMSEKRLGTCACAVKNPTGR